MSLLSEFRASLFLLSLWARNHFLEIFLAALFALPFAYLAGAYLEHPDPFKVYVVADRDTNQETMETFREKAKPNLAKIGDVDVIVELRQLPEDSEDAALKMAADLSKSSDTLMVIGSGRSQLTEKSLPIYFGARPRVPYLSTTATDDDLLKYCDEKCSELTTLSVVSQRDRFAPLLQLSPTNRIQASSAVEYAIENGKHRFLIISGNDSQNKAYTDNLVSEYEAAILDAGREGAFEINKFEVSGLPDDAKLKQMNPEVVLYAGNFGEAQTAFNRFSHLQTASDQIMMILSDAVIQTRGSDIQLSSGFKPQSSAPVLPVRFTHQTVATDYNGHVSTYDRDSFAIAKALIEDMNDRGVDLLMRAKSLFHIHRASDARRNLNRILRENSAVRTWYLGEPRSGERPNIYIFKGSNQYNGIFHVWKLHGPESNPGMTMDDVDHWHPGRAVAAAQDDPVLSSRR